MHPVLATATGGRSYFGIGVGCTVPDEPVDPLPLPGVRVVRGVLDMPGVRFAPGVPVVLIPGVVDDIWPLTPPE
jgi:hypothetical protein